MGEAKVDPLTLNRILTGFEVLLTKQLGFLVLPTP